MPADEGEKGKGKLNNSSRCATGRSSHVSRVMGEKVYQSDVLGMAVAQTLIVEESEEEMEKFSFRPYLVRLEK